MKILLVGGGGREHALAWSLSRPGASPPHEIVAAPGNPGIAELARCEAVSAADVETLTALAESERADLVVVGPEAPLAAGLVDRCHERGIAAFGPTLAAARIETSKRYAKAIMARAGVPTARASSHEDMSSALRAIHDFGAPVVIKASGLAAGKGVIVCSTEEQAEQAARAMLEGGAFGAAGRELLVEEFMEGEELSLFALTDGTHVRTMLPAQDHKRLVEGDNGPNTGGMGAYAPVHVATSDLVHHIEQHIFLPVLSEMRADGTPFTGLLYAGLMLTEDGPRVVEFNCRFGDPETQAILPLLDSSLAEPLLAIARGESIEGLDALQWGDGAAVTTVLAAEGYPESPRRGDPVHLPPGSDDVLVFHAGTARDDTGQLVTAGGRVLAVTGVGATFDDARLASVRAAGEVHFAGKQFRGDIGWRESGRRAGAA
jgi:phosphoribosylamine--glycine ligase